MESTWVLCHKGVFVAGYATEQEAIAALEAAIRQGALDLTYGQLWHAARPASEAAAPKPEEVAL